MRRWLGLAALALFALGPARAEETPDVPKGDAAIRGRLVPSGGARVEDALVILYSLTPDGEPGLRSTRSDAKGEFAFESISSDPKIVYLVGARVGGVPFGSRAAFAPGERVHRVEIAVSEPQQDLSKLTRGDVRLRFEQGCTHLRVQESHVLQNDSGRVIYIPPEKRGEAEPLLTAVLPAGAEGFEPLPSEAADGLENTGDRVRFWGPLHPGRHDVEWGYGLPLRDSLPLRVELPDGARQVQILTPADAIRVRGAGLAAEGTRALPSGLHALQTAGPIPRAGALDLEVEIPAPQGGAKPRVEEARMWLELDDAALDVSEQHVLHVDGDRALESTGGAPLICIPLPEQATALRFASGTLGLGLTRDPSGALALHGPIPPGETQLALRYQIPSAGHGATRFSRRFASEVPLLEMYVADTGLLAESARLHRKRPIVTEDRIYLDLEAFSIEPGEEVSLSLSPLPARSPGSGMLASGVVLLGALAALGFLVAPLRSGGPGSEARAETPATTERLAVYRSIEALDEDLETGKVAPEDHASMRAALRARAVALLAAERAGERLAPKPAPATPSCAGCGAALRPSDRFCSQCGAPRPARGDAPA